MKMKPRHHSLSAVAVWLALAGSMAVTAQAASLQEACQALSSAQLDGAVIGKVAYQSAGPAAEDPERMMTGASGRGAMLPAHCVVQGEIEPRTGADGRHYGIRFEVRLPDVWQQRLMFQGGGGMDGFLANALGTIPTLDSSAAPALARGYAVVSMDGGHADKSPAFGLDQQARLDFAYAAIGKVTREAKSLVARYYAAAPAHTYFMGCSNGGREAMMAAQRYPLEFDGIVAGNPGFHLSRAALAEVWDSQAFMSIAPKDDAGHKVLSQALSNADLSLLSKAVLAQCDKLDGIQDGIINDYRACHFDPAVLQCQAGAAADCLAADKVSVLKRVFDGAKNSQGEALYSSWPYDAGVAAPGWRMWKLGFSPKADKPDALNVILGMPGTASYFMTPPEPGFDLFSFDFDRDVARLAQTGAINDATATYLNTYAARGGKLLVFQGLSDPVFSANDIMGWFDSLARDTHGGDERRRDAWARLFMVPGMTHCGGGTAFNDFDPLGAIEQWVEQGKAPAFLPAKSESFPGQSQPLCVYPAVARYQGGTAGKLGSYRCELPTEGTANTQS